MLKRDSQQFKAALQQIGPRGSILLITHQKPDGDACGSLLALYTELSRCGYNVGTFVNDPVPNTFQFLPRSFDVTTDPAILEKSWDLVIVMDAGDWKHTRVPEEFIARANRDSTIIVIDHHQTNLGYGDINLIDVTASSTCEILYHLWQGLGWPMTPAVATCLLTGIITDTSNFLNAATTASALGATADLVRAGGRARQVFNEIYRANTLNDLRLWGVVLERLVWDREHDIAYSYVFNNDFESLGLSSESSEGIVDFMQSLEGPAIIALFKITPTMTKVSLRTRRDDVDVSRLASHFGGGGHRKASGFALPEPLVPIDGLLELPDLPAWVQLPKQADSATL